MPTPIVKVQQSGKLTPEELELIRGVSSNECKTDKDVISSLTLRLLAEYKYLSAQLPEMKKCAVLGWQSARLLAIQFDAKKTEAAADDVLAALEATE